MNIEDRHRRTIGRCLENRRAEELIAHLGSGTSTVQHALNLFELDSNSAGDSCTCVVPLVTTNLVHGLPQHDSKLEVLNRWPQLLVLFDHMSLL